MLDSTASQATLPSHSALLASNNQQGAAAGGQVVATSTTATAAGTAPSGIEMGHSRNSSNTSQVCVRFRTAIWFVLDDL